MGEIRSGYRFLWHTFGQQVTRNVVPLHQVGKSHAGKHAKAHGLKKLVLRSMLRPQRDETVLHV